MGQIGETSMKNSKALLTLGLALGCAAFPFSLAVCAEAQTIACVVRSRARPVKDCRRWPGGTHFEVSPTGKYTELYTFDVCGLTGYLPSPWLIQGTDGLIYGSTIYGGGPGCDDNGSIYSLSMGLNPLVITVPTRGAPGKSVLILGNNLTGSTSVTFNGVGAKFTVESDTYIKATVPTSATTGVVSVVTPSGTLNNNPQFVVSK
jgi:hypothetical protein